MGGFYRADRGQLIYGPKMEDEKMLSAGPKMSEAIYFVVLKGLRGIYAAKYHDHLPSDKYSRDYSRPPAFVRGACRYM
jgi:hypothetical protein